MTHDVVLPGCCFNVLQKRAIVCVRVTVWAHSLIILTLKQLCNISGNIATKTVAKLLHSVWEYFLNRKSFYPIYVMNKKKPSGCGFWCFQTVFYQDISLSPSQWQNRENFKECLEYCQNFQIRPISHLKCVILNVKMVLKSATWKAGEVSWPHVEIMSPVLVPGVVSGKAPPRRGVHHHPSLRLCREPLRL